MDIGERIKQRRLELNFSLREAAKRAGATSSTFHKWEAGDIANMGVDKVKKVAKALDVTPAYLMGWEEKDAGVELPEDVLQKAKALYEDPGLKILLDVKEKLSTEELNALLLFAKSLMEKKK